MPDRLTLGFSPCPNDTFMFDAMVHHRIDTAGLDFDVTMADVEELNQKAFRGELDITKLSYHAYAHLTDTYELLHTGSALGRNCGPLLVCRAEKPVTNDAVNAAKIAIPGKYTTANFLLSLAYPAAQHKQEMLFSDIEKAVLDGTVDAGLLIHENRFTYADRGLQKIVDLGEFWESETGSPIPLGGIVVKRSLPAETKRTINQLIGQSVRHAFDHPSDSLPYVRAHAQEMDEKVMYQHIDLYVNQYSVDLGEDGRKAVTTLFDSARAKGVVPHTNQPLFVDA